MNNILELVEIIKNYGSEISLDDICYLFQEKYKDSLSQIQKSTIEKTLNDNPSFVLLNSRGMWELVDNKNVKINERNSKVTDNQVTDSWRKYYKYIDTYHPDLRINHIKGERGFNAIWPEILTPIKGVRIYHKTLDGRIDLTLPRVSERIDFISNRLKGILDKDMEIVKTHKSLAIRINSSKIDFHRNIDNQNKEMKEAFEKIERLENLFNENEFMNLMGDIYGDE